MGGDVPDDVMHDRRRNPFPSLNDTEYALFLATIRDEARTGVEEALQRDCVRVCPRIEAVESVVFGASERGVIGLDDRMRAVEGAVTTLRRVTWLAVGALITGGIGLLIGLIQFAVLGR
jgi:hypothetical protein